MGRCLMPKSRVPIAPLLSLWDLVCILLEHCYCKIEVLILYVLRALPDSISPYPMESRNCPFACRPGMRSCVHIYPLFFSSFQGMSISFLYY